MIRRLLAALALSLTAALAIPTLAGAAPLRTVAGRPITKIGAGVPTPTAFAFGDGHVFVAGGGGSLSRTGGGVYVLGRPSRRLAGSPGAVEGLTFHGGTLYLSGGDTLMAWSGWNGHRFTSRRTLWTGPAGFPGFDGLGFGADDRLYVGVGVSANEDDDHGPTARPYARDILSFASDGSDLRVFATGIRQPWQLAFPSGSSSPFVAVLGQDHGPGSAHPPDFILRVRAGQDYGFPTCNWGGLNQCAGDTHPLVLLAPHTDPLGIAVLGRRVYVNELFGTVLSTGLDGGRRTAVAYFGHHQILALANHSGRLYVGQFDGEIDRFTP